MSVVRWNPIREFEGLFGRGMEHEDYRHVDRDSPWHPLVDIRETSHSYTIDMEVPAVAPKDIDVNVKDDVLTVSGERKIKLVGDGDSEERSTTHRVERNYGAFARSFKLPEDANESKISARTENGVLYLELAKREEVLPRNIKVDVH